jgi:outer membrane protein assembly factor BamB
LYGLSAAGELLWEHEFGGRPFDWVLKSERLVFTLEGSNGPVWSIDGSGPTAGKAAIGGRPVIVGDDIFVYAADGVYRLNSETLAAELMYALPLGSPSRGDMVALPQGGLLVAHRDGRDGRLIVLNDDGSVRWERSYADVLSGQQRLLMVDGHPFLVSQSGTSSSPASISVLAIDLNRSELLMVFSGGNRDPRPGRTSAFAVGDGRILVNIGGSRLVMLDTRLALEAVSQAAISQ